MTVIAHYKAVPETVRGFSVALGNFDGIHAGHRAVLTAAKSTKQHMAVATFEPPPRTFFRPNDPPFRLYRPERRNARLLELGAQAIYELPFTASMAAMTDADFAREVLHEGLGVSHVTTGFDFRFGRGRMGDATRLASFGRALGFEVTIVDKVEKQGNKVSSTAIREALIAGEPERAACMLGHHWIVDGLVEHGEKRGRDLGFPTANLHLGDLLHPRHGVYAVRLRIGDETLWRDGVANFGRTPTTGIRDPLLETFVFDFDGDLYGQFIEVALIAWLRQEQVFESPAAMVRQMNVDTKDARGRLKAVP